MTAAEEHAQYNSRGERRRRDAGANDTKSAVARTAWAKEYKVNRIVSRYEYRRFFAVMAFLFVIQDQRFPNRVVIIIRFVRAGPPPHPPGRGPRGRRERKRRKRIVNEGIILLGSAPAVVSL